MILDKLLQFDPAATNVTVTAASTNVLDFLNARELAVDVGPMQMLAVVTVGTAFAAVGAATLTVQYQLSVDNAAWVIGNQTDAIPKANLTAGQTVKVPVPFIQPQSAGIPRYHRLNYVVAVGPFTAGSVESDLVANPQANHPPVYPAGFAVAN